MTPNEQDKIQVYHPLSATPGNRITTPKSILGSELSQANVVPSLLGFTNIRKLKQMKKTAKEQITKEIPMMLVRRIVKDLVLQFKVR